MVAPSFERELWRMNDCQADQIDRLTQELLRKDKYIALQRAEIWFLRRRHWAVSALWFGVGVAFMLMGMLIKDAWPF